MRASLAFLALVPIATACGGSDGHAVPDAQKIADSAVLVDAKPDGTPLPAGCDYAELADTTNDDFTQAGTAEVTGLTLATQVTLCGTIDSTHYDAGSTTVDVDSFAITLAADADVLVELSGVGTEALAPVWAYVYTGSGFTVEVTHANWQGDHAVVAVHLPADSYEFSMLAGNNAAISAPIPYKLRVKTDTPATRCAAVTATANFTEANDGTNSDQNDVVAIDFAQPTPATLIGAGAPEPSNITVAPATSYRITGISADNAQVGSYKDRDTYAFTTGATTNQLSLRVDWTGSTFDLDAFVYPEAVPEIAAASVASMTSPEFQTFAVKPNTTYWVWVGDYYTSTGAPVTYDISLCGETFTAP